MVRFSNAADDIPTVSVLGEIHTSRMFSPRHTNRLWAIVYMIELYAYVYFVDMHACAQPNNDSRRGITTFAELEAIRVSMYMLLEC